jgi:hypothetical protein
MTDRRSRLGMIGNRCSVLLYPVAVSELFPQRGAKPRGICVSMIENTLHPPP